MANRGLERIILTQHGQAKLLPKSARKHYWESDYQLPDGKVVTGTIARLMRRDYSRNIAACYRDLVALENKYGRIL